jgi:CheY-like chemotaxis protein
MTGRILLVDDDEAIRHLLSGLTGLGCDVVTAPDGVAALELATHGPPRPVISVS